MTLDATLALLTELRSMGVTLVDGGERLLFWPRSATTEAVRRRLKREKPSVLQLLRGHVGPDELPSDWRVEWEERAAIREYDGGQAREHAEAEAMAEILARMREVRMFDATEPEPERDP